MSPVADQFSPNAAGLFTEFEGAKEMKQGFTVGQIARTLRCHERSARLYLHEVNQAIDHYAENIGELIDLQTVLALCRRHQNSMLGRRLALLLQTI